MRRDRKQRRTVKQMNRSLQLLGYSGFYDRVCVFARRWKQAQRELAQTAGRGAFVPLRFSSGEAFQFDWCEDFAVINGERTKLQIAHFKLGPTQKTGKIVR